MFADNTARQTAIETSFQQLDFSTNFGDIDFFGNWKRFSQEDQVVFGSNPQGSAVFSM